MQSRYGLVQNPGSIVDKNGEMVANFSFDRGEIYYSPEDMCTPEMLQLHVYQLNTRHTVDLDLRDRHLLRQLINEIPTCRVVKASAVAAIEADMLESLEGGRRQPLPLYFRQHGFNQLKDGRHVFVAGDEVLVLPEEETWAISPNIARAHLAYDKNLSCEEAVQKFWTVLKRDGNVVLPVWGYTLMSAMRSQLTGLSASTYPSLVVSGNQGFGKTTVCQRFCLLYEDKQADMRPWAQRDMRVSSASAIETVNDHRDQVVLMDDVAKSISPGEVRERKARMAEILRFASNETNRTKMAPDRRVVDYFCKAGIVFNSEYALDNPSDIERTIIVNITHEMQGGAEIERIYAASVFRYFILWLLPRLDTEISDLRDQMASILGNHQRLRKNYLMVLWALELFFHFAVDSGAATQKKADKMLARAKEVCDDLLDQQIEKVEKLSGPQNIGWHILTGIQKEILEETSKKAVRKGKALPRYYYIRKKEEDMYCIPSEILYHYCMRETPLRFLSTIAMNRQLVKEGLIQPSQDRKAASVRIDGKRYLGIRRVDLVVAASETYQ